MRRFFAIPVVAALCIACSGDDDANSPLEVVEAEGVAVEQADVDDFVALWSSDGVFAFPDGSEFMVWDEAPFEVEDFDGDGTRSMMDAWQASVALAGPFDGRVDNECQAVSETVVECVDRWSDIFSRNAGLEHPGETYRRTVENGLLVRSEFSPESEAEMVAVVNFEEAVGAEMGLYQRWVLDHHADEHDVMFRDSCCTGDIAATPESVEAHSEIIVEYRETLGT